MDAVHTQHTTDTLLQSNTLNSPLAVINRINKNNLVLQNNLTSVGLTLQKIWTLYSLACKSTEAFH